MTPHSRGTPSAKFVVLDFGNRRLPKSNVAPLTMDEPSETPIDTDLLRRWLGLPPGEWPPEDRSLLGLPVGPLNADDVQTRALERMEKLRPHQLRHPELVTEGMNRLAQALIAVEYEALREITTAPPTLTKVVSLVAPRKRPAVDPEIVLDADLLNSHAEKPKSPEPREDSDSTMIFDAEIVEPELGQRPPIRFEAMHHALAEQSPVRVVPVPSVVLAVPAGLAFEPFARRKRIAELVRLRRRMRVWNGLRNFFAAPTESLSTSAAVFEFLDAVHEFQTDDMRQKEDWPVDHGRLVLAVVRQSLTLTLFRTLQPQQRSAVAGDWAMAAGELEGLSRALRASLKTGKPRSRTRQLLSRSRACIGRTPEILLIAILGVAAFVSWLRSSGR